jgi:hypothetical protein
LVEFLLALGGVFEAEAGVWSGDGHAAAAAAGGTVLTMGESGIECSCRVREFGIHESSFLKLEGRFHFGNFEYTPRQFS